MILNQVADIMKGSCTSTSMIEVSAGKRYSRNSLGFGAENPCWFHQLHSLDDSIAVFGPQFKESHYLSINSNASAVTDCLFLRGHFLYEDYPSYPLTSDLAL